jgi:Glucodextranase, domain B/PASTA domain
MRRSFLLLACLCAAATGCGGGDEERAQRAPLAVELDVDSPADNAVVRSDTVEVRGTVEPGGAAVMVLGRHADTVGGTFSSVVELQPGANVIDVIATARGRGPAMTAVRVTRELPVEVPDIGGLEVAEAESRLEESGLVLAPTIGGGLLDELLPGEPGACDQEPTAGTEVRRGTTVKAEFRKSC